MEVKWVKDYRVIEHLMVKNYDKWYKVTAMFTDRRQCNDYLAANILTSKGTDDGLEGVIRVIGDCIFLAKCSDKGV